MDNLVGDEKAEIGEAQNGAQIGDMTQDCADKMGAEIAAHDPPPPGRGRVKVDIEALSQVGPVILLARHGKPALSRKVRINARGYEDWWKLYDEGGLADGQKPPLRLLQAVSACKKLLSSPLRRAAETAAAVACGRPVEANGLFVEAPLPPPLFPTWLKFSPRTWGVFARFSWYIGFHRETESRDEAEARARLAASHLISEAKTHGSVACLAHGWFNRMMGAVLLQRGFVRIRDGGDFHWAFRVYARAKGKAKKRRKASY